MSILLDRPGGNMEKKLIFIVQHRVEVLKSILRPVFCLQCRRKYEQQLKWHIFYLWCKIKFIRLKFLEEEMK